MIKMLSMRQLASGGRYPPQWSHFAVESMNVEDVAEVSLQILPQAPNSMVVVVLVNRIIEEVEPTWGMGPIL